MSKEVVLTESTKRLAAALQDCFQEATQVGREQLREEMDERFDKVDFRLEKQDATLRMFWKQMKGKGPLPIDD